MSTHEAASDYSIDGDHDDLRAEFDQEFDWEDPDEYRADSCYCDTGSSDICCV